MAIIEASDYSSREQLFVALPHGGVGVEVGVSHGEFAKRLIEYNEPAHLFLVDCWCVQPPEVADRGDPVNCHTQEEYDGVYEECRTRMRDAGFEQRTTLIRDFSVDAARRFNDNVFDWVWIDANHLRAYEDALAWWPKVKPGGYLGGHDYDMHSTFVTVRQDVNRFAAERGLKITVTLGRDPCWLIYKAPDRQD
jgi:hypothetical protein